MISAASASGTGRRRWILLSGLLAALACAWIVATTSLTADLSAFVPRGDPVADLLLEQLHSGPTTRLILMGLSGDSEATRVAASQQLAERLRHDPLFARVANGADALPEAELQTLFAHRYLLSPAISAERFTAEGLHAALEQRLRDLQSPLAILQKRWLPEDPTGELLELLRVWRGDSEQPTKRSGVWFSPDGKNALLLAETRASGYDLAAQHAAVAAIRAAFAASAGTGVTLALSGPGVLATLAEDQIRAEAELRSTLAMAAMILILIGVYRSARTVWVGALPMLAALLAGAAAVDLLFDGIYMITLAFSMTLLGETLDYPTYLFSHRRSGESVADTLRQLWPTLRLCAATTLLGCLAMITPNFPGLSQLGVFTLAGIVAAVATTRWLLPALLPTDWVPPQPGEVGPWADRLLEPRPRLALTLGVLGLLLLIALLVRAPPLWEDDIAALSPVPRALLQLDQELRNGLGAPEVGRMIVISAPDAETALRHGERIATWLDAHRAEGAFAGYDGPMRYLPSQQTQQWRQAQLPTADTLAADLAHATAGSPFKPEAFQPFLAAVAATRNAPLLRPEDLRGTLLGTRVDALLFAGEHGWTALLPLRGVRNPQILIADLPQIANSQARYLDLRAETSRLVADFRAAALARFGWGAGLIVALVWIGLRSWRRVAAALLPVLLALVITVAALLALGERLSLFHLVSLLLVLGIGVDYGLFFSRPGTDPAMRRRTLHALLVCCGSALTVFALLSTSTLPALHAIGLTVSLGVATSFIAALALARPLLTRISE